jgi:hypothetical protein
MDADLKAVVGYMQNNVETSRLVQIAARLNELALLLWGHYSQQEVQAPLRVSPEPISAQRTESAANG